MIHSVREISFAVGGSLAVLIFACGCGLLKKRRAKMKKEKVERERTGETIVSEEVAHVAKNLTTDLSKSVVGMTRLEKEELVNRMKAMSQEEMELALDVIPVEMCLARVNRELDRLKTFENSVKSAVNG